MMSRPANSHARLADGLRWTGLLIILSVAAMRCLARFAPMLVFDSDPKLDATPLDGFSPAGSLALDALLLLGAGVAIVGESAAGRSIRWRWLALAALPLPVVLWHGMHEAEHLWRGLTWAAGIIAAVTIMHLARDAAMRRLTLATLLAVLAPLLVRGAMQVTVEHERTIEQFETQREAFFQARGWDPDGTLARIYERRLRQPQPLGWFMTTNIYASLVAAGAVAMLALAWYAKGERRIGAAGWIGLVLAALTCGAALWLAQSKGAMLACVVGAGGIAVVAAASSMKCAVSWRVGAVAAAALLPAVLGVIALRGGVLSEDFAGDRSLLFRWHYLVASAGVIGEQPMLGVGPGGFQDAYMRHRVPRNPEEVASAHNVFADWLAMFGVLATAWCVVLGWQFARIGAAMARLTHAIDDGADDRAGAHARFSRSAVYATLTIGLAAAVPALLAELHVLHDVDYVARVVGLAGLMAAMVGFVGLFAALPSRATTLAAGAGAIVLIVHGQIEMTFTQPGSAVWVLLMLAVAAPVRSGDDARGRTHSHWPAWSVGGALALAACAVVIFGAWPARQQQLALIESAKIIAKPHDSRIEVAKQRLSAAERLDKAAQYWPIHEAVARLGPQQRIVAADLLSGDAALEALDHALIDIERGWRRFERTAWLGLGRQAAVRRARITGSEDDWAKAIEWAERLADRDPHGPGVWLSLGHTRWQAGRRDAAADAYRRALANHEAMVLDPLKQLTEAERERVEQRLNSTQ